MGKSDSNVNVSRGVEDRHRSNMSQGESNAEMNESFMMIPMDSKLVDRNHSQLNMHKSHFSDSSEEL